MYQVILQNYSNKCEFRVKSAITEKNTLPFSRLIFRDICQFVHWLFSEFQYNRRTLDHGVSFPEQINGYFAFADYD